MGAEWTSMCDVRIATHPGALRLELRAPRPRPRHRRRDLAAATPRRRADRDAAADVGRLLVGAGALATRGTWTRVVEPDGAAWTPPTSWRAASCAACPRPRRAPSGCSTTVSTARLLEHQEASRAELLACFISEEHARGVAAFIEAGERPHGPRRARQVQGLARRSRRSRPPWPTGIRERLRTTSTVVERPIADGGEGTVDCAVGAGFEPLAVRVRGPFGELRRGPHRRARRRRGRRARRGVWVAPARLADRSRRSTRTPVASATRCWPPSTTAAAGSRSASAGASRPTAGSAWRGRWVSVPSTRTAHELGYGGGALGGLATGWTPRASTPRIREADLTLATDVDSPLLGPRGAARLFAPQKGAGPRPRSSSWSRRWRTWPTRSRGSPATTVRDLPGCGAAGGVGHHRGRTSRRASRARAPTCSPRSSGSTPWCDEADLVVTGEGRWDEQTAARQGADARRPPGRRRRQTGGGGGRRGDGATRRPCARRASTDALALTDLEPDPAVCMTQAAELLVEAGRRVADRASLARRT